MIATLGLLLGPGPALADWMRLDGPGLVEALTGSQIDYGGAAWQSFQSSGRTLYRTGESPSGTTSQGLWREQGGSYCSRWPPGADWTCYAVEVDGSGGVRFIDDAGSVSAGRFLPEAE
jgi:hypothetical protein